MKKIDLLLSLYIASIIVSELLGVKTFKLWGLNASVAIFALPLTYSINDIVVEVWGKKRAISFVKSGLAVLVFLTFFTSLALALPPTDRFLASNAAYSQIFGKSLRIMFASLAAFWFSERFDVLIFSKIRNKLGKQKLWLRNNLSNFVSQLIDTTIFMFLAFYSPGQWWFVISLIGPYWLLKCAFSILQTPFTYWGVQWLRRE